MQAKIVSVFEACSEGTASSRIKQFMQNFDGVCGISPVGCRTIGKYRST